MNKYNLIGTFIGMLITAYGLYKANLDTGLRHSFMYDIVLNTFIMIIGNFIIALYLSRIIKGDE